MTLVSPGVSVTVTDNSAYATAGQGTVPMIFVATAANKLSPDGVTIAPGTQENGVVRLVTSQRDLITTYGAPIFETINGTVNQGSEISEYGLHAAYSYMAIANTAYIVRADIDLAQLTYSETPPTGQPVNGTYWFDEASTSFGIFRANGSSTPGLAWDSVTPLIPTSAQVDGSSVPLTGFGANGNIAVVTLTTSNITYEKISGTWYEIGSTGWKAARPTVALGTVANPLFTINNTIVVNGTSVSLTGTTIAQTVIDINAASIANVSAANVSNKLQLTLSTGGDLTIGGTDRTTAGLNTSYLGYHMIYSPHTTVPNGSHTGSIWVKTTNPNFGANYVVKRYSSSTGQFAIVTAPFYVDDSTATTAYGAALAIGSLYVQYNSSGSSQNPIATQIIKRYDGSAWDILTYIASSTPPTTAPVDGTLWISNAFQVDVMANSGDSWLGYLDMYPSTDPNGVQITSAQPTTQSTGSPLVDQDLWLDSADLDNYPAFYRWNATLSSWVLIDKTDHTTPFGMIAADARNNADGTLTGSTLVTDMLVSDYVDPDAPNPETYPAGMLLFNTRYSTYNVKTWDSTKFAGVGSYTVGTATFSAPSYVARWVTASGNELNGVPYMGRFAQHEMVVKALKALVTSNDAIRSEAIYFNLLAAPGYPEMDLSLQGLNVDRKETAFLIVDTPMRLAPDGTSLQNWATNAANVPGTDEDGRVARYDFSAEYYPCGLGINIDGSQVAIPSSSVALPTYAYNDSVAYVWMSPAGTQRGIVQNASSVGYITSSNEFKPVSLNQGQRDTLYTNNINPIVFQPSRGLLIYGDETLSSTSTALDRINVARLICYLRYQLDQLAQPFLFQLNTDSTRQAAESIFKRYLGDLMSNGALNDFSVVCDTTNNTPEVIDANQLYIDVAIIPNKSINFIYIPIVLQNTGTLP